MARPKIALVGGGSYKWSPKIIQDILLTKTLENAEFRLLDINLEAAQLIAAVGKHYCSAWSMDARFMPTSDPARAFDGADFVVITISTGGLDAMKHDLKIPEQYGIFHTVGDSVGPGGWARSLRNIPIFMTLAEQIKKYCPRAFILNYSNPMATLTRTLSLCTPQPVVGLCHGPFENYTCLADIFGLKDDNDICAHYAGVNHFFWMTDFTVCGKPGYPKLKRKLRGGKSLDDLLHTVHADEAGFSSKRRLVASELFEEFGILPYLGDRHICEFFGRYITQDLRTLEKYKLIRTTIADRHKRMRNAHRLAIKIAADKIEVPKRRSRETAADIMDARCAGREFADVMNLPNIGQVPNLPPGAVIEAPGLVNTTGFTPAMCAPLPQQLLNIILPHAVNQEMIVQAGMEGSWPKAYQALINDPLCAHLTIPRIKKMGLRLLEANKQYLPQFFG